MLLKRKKGKRINIKARPKRKKEKNILDNVSDQLSLMIPDFIDEKRDYICTDENNYTRTFALSVYPSEIG